MKKSKLPKGLTQEQPYTYILREVKTECKQIRKKRRRNIIKILLFI